VSYSAGANVLNIKNEKPLRAGQVFTVSLGVSGLANADATDARAKTYALQVCVKQIVYCLPCWLAVCLRCAHCGYLCSRLSVVRLPARG
jgi:nucleosome binding factor SPN SPT16 subunit